MRPNRRPARAPIQRQFNEDVDPLLESQIINKNNVCVQFRGQTLCQDNRQLIGMSLIGLARQAKNRSQLYFLLKCSLSIWAYGGV